MHLNSRRLFEKYLRRFFKSGMRVLEIGADARAPYVFRDLVGDSSVQWDTLDIVPAFPGQTYVSANEYEFPVPDSCFDIVFSASVIEHVKKPWVWMRELSRVCKKDGHVLTIAPVSWTYHAVPFDCWRIFPEGMRALYEDAGMEMVLLESESLEPTALPYCYPGRTHSTEAGLKGRLKLQIKKIIKWPVTYAVDTVGAGKKV